MNIPTSPWWHNWKLLHCCLSVCPWQWEHNSRPNAQNRARFIIWFYYSKAYAPVAPHIEKTWTDVQRKTESTTIRNPFVSIGGSLPCPRWRGSRSIWCRLTCQGFVGNRVDGKRLASEDVLQRVCSHFHGRLLFFFLSVSTRIQRT